MARVAQIPFGAQGGPQPTRQELQRLQLAQALMQQGSSTAPVQTPLEGLGRASQAWAGALMDKREQAKMDERRKAYGDDMAAILKGASAQPWVNPDTGQQMGQAGGLAGALATSDRLQTPEARASLAQMQLAQILNPPKAARPMAVSPGSVVIDPKTGQPIFSAPHKPDTLSPEAFDQQARLRAAGRTTVDNKIINTGEDAFAKALGTENAKGFLERGETARDAVQSLTANHEARKLLDSGVISGFGADFKVGMGKMLQAAGINIAPDAIANTEAFVGQRAQEVGRLIKMFGAGTGLSDQDRKFATQAAAGDIEMTEASIRRLLDIGDKAAKNVVTTYNKDAEKIDPRLSPYPLTVELPVFPDDEDPAVKTFGAPQTPGVKFLGFEK